MELTKQQKIAALNYALLTVLKAKELNTSAFLCWTVSAGVDKVLDKMTYIEDLQEYIPEFVRPKEALYRSSSYWWPFTDFDSRIQYLENLIKQIETQA